LVDGVAAGVAGEGLQHLQKLAPVGPRARHLLTVDRPAPGFAQLLKLAVERLAHSADAGIADRAVLRFLCGHIL